LKQGEITYHFQFFGFQCFLNRPPHKFLHPGGIFGQFWTAKEGLHNGAVVCVLRGIAFNRKLTERSYPGFRLEGDVEGIRVAEFGCVFAGLAYVPHAQQQGDPLPVHLDRQGGRCLPGLAEGVGRSRGTRVIGDHVGEFVEGELYVLGPHLPHVFRNTSSSQNGAFARVLHFDMEIWNGMLEESPELLRFRNLLESSRRGLCYSGTVAGKGADILQRMQRVRGVARVADFFALATLLTTAPPTSPLASPGYTGSAGDLMEDRVRDACQYILEHFDKDLRIVTLARRAGLTPDAFSRMFHRGTRKPYQQFLLDVRLGHACRLLVESDLPIIEIAYASGFRNLSNFNRRFRATYHQTPRDYRNVNR
jgi:AraC-like DNA-binding protein